MFVAGAGAAVIERLAAHPGLHAHKTRQAGAAVIGFACREGHGFRGDVGTQGGRCGQAVVTAVATGQAAAADRDNFGRADIPVVERGRAQAQADRVAGEHADK